MDAMTALLIATPLFLVAFFLLVDFLVRRRKQTLVTNPSSRQGSYQQMVGRTQRGERAVILDADDTQALMSKLEGGTATMGDVQQLMQEAEKPTLFVPASLTDGDTVPVGGDVHHHHHHERHVNEPAPVPEQHVQHSTHFPHHVEHSSHYEPAPVHESHHSSDYSSHDSSSYDSSSSDSGSSDSGGGDSGGGGGD